MHMSASTRSKLSLAGRKSVAARTTARRSKHEVQLYQLCSAVWSNALSNSIIADGWDADIVLPAHKICIMWNGPWHYRQLSIKNHSLKQVQNRDRIKTDLFRSLGWKVLVFEDRYFTPETAMVDIIHTVDLLRKQGLEPAS